MHIRRDASGLGEGDIGVAGAALVRSKPAVFVKDFGQQFLQSLSFSSRLIDLVADHLAHGIGSQARASPSM
jgi:hypothetical protein